MNIQQQQVIEEEVSGETNRLSVMATTAIERAMEAMGIRRVDVAEALNVPKSRVTKVLGGETNMTLHTLAQFGLACGVRWQFVGVKADDPSAIVTAPESLMEPLGSPYVAQVEEASSLVCEDDEPHPAKGGFSLAA